MSTIESDLPRCHLERDSRIALGGISLSALKLVTKLAGEAEGARILADLKSVEVATYRLVDAELCQDLARMGSFEAELRELGWLLTFKERDGGDAAWVFARNAENGSIEGLYVVTLDRNELEIVRVEGRIDEVLAEAIEYRPGEAAETLITGY